MDTNRKLRTRTAKPLGRARARLAGPSAPLGPNEGAAPTGCRDEPEREPITCWAADTFQGRPLRASAPLNHNHGECGGLSAAADELTETVSQLVSRARWAPQLVYGGRRRDGAPSTPPRHRRDVSPPSVDTEDKQRQLEVSCVSSPLCLLARSRLARASSRTPRQWKWAPVGARIREGAARVGRNSEGDEREVFQDEPRRRVAVITIARVQSICAKTKGQRAHQPPAAPSHCLCLPTPSRLLGGRERALRGRWAHIDVCAQLALSAAVIKIEIGPNAARLKVIISPTLRAPKFCAGPAQSCAIVWLRDLMQSRRARNLRPRPVGGRSSSLESRDTCCRR